MSKELTEEMIGLDRFSPSGLTCYEECPKLFYYTNWLGLKLDQDMRHMDFGTAIHSALEVLYAEYDDNFKGAWEYASFAKVEKHFLKKWKNTSVTFDSYINFKSTKAGRESDINSPEDLYEMMKKDGIEMLKSYWENKEDMLVQYGHDLVDFEIKKRVYLHNPEDPEDRLPIPLSYIIDANTRLRNKIIDFKTSGSKYDEAETRKKLQGQLYLLAEWIDKGEFIELFDYIVLRKGLKSKDRVEVVQLKYDKADMLALYIRVKAILQKIANREFSAPIKGHSPWCQCREFEKQLSVK